MADVLLSLPRFILFSASDVACRLLGLGLPSKRKPEQMFGNKNDVLHALREANLKGVRQDDVDALRSAFEPKSGSAQDCDGHYWTRETLMRLMAQDENSLPFSADAADVLWRMIQSFSSFPFPPEDNFETLSWNSYLHAYALVRSSCLVPHSPGYCIDPPGTRGQRNFRKRTSEDSNRFIFQALASSDYDRSIETPKGERPMDSDADLRDVMVACMDLDMDKYAWRADDFTPAIRRLPLSNSRRHLDLKLNPEEFERLCTLATSIRSITAGWLTPAEPLNVKKYADNPRVQAGGDSVCISGPEPISWPDFSEAVANKMPDMYDLLRKYILHVLMSILPERKGHRLQRERTQYRSPQHVTVDNDDEPSVQPP